jgi:hypothetical protein
MDGVQWQWVVRRIIGRPGFGLKGEVLNELKAETRLSSSLHFIRIRIDTYFLTNSRDFGSVLFWLLTGSCAGCLPSVGFPFRGGEE